MLVETPAKSLVAFSGKCAECTAKVLCINFLLDPSVDITAFKLDLHHS